MREIKFRAWDEKDQKMVYDFVDNNKGRVSLNEKGQLVKSTWYTLLQYTGLKDKNGKKDFIGDLIKVLVPKDKGRGFELKGIAETVWNDTYSRTEFIYRTGDFVGKTFEGYELIECYEHENIGNIYEHSHLLKQPL